jgi:hypothetical protein
VSAKAIREVIREALEQCAPATVSVRGERRGRSIQEVCSNRIRLTGRKLLRSLGIHLGRIWGRYNRK